MGRLGRSRWFLAAYANTDGDIAFGWRFIKQLSDERKVFVAHPVHNKTVGRQQKYGRTFFYRMHGPDPGIKLLWRKLPLKTLKTVFPWRKGQNTPRIVFK
jgi:hypothetical protein